MRTTTPMNGTIKFRLPQAEKDRLFELATDLNISVADFIRNAIASAVNMQTERKLGD
jgi:predicted DNA-binding protein